MSAASDLPGKPDEFAALHCRPGAARLSPADLAIASKALPEWKHVDDRIERSYSFRDFHATIGFVNAVAWMANREDHHPDLQVSYNRCVVAWSTHDAGGVTRNDVICAARTDRLFAGD